MRILHIDSERTWRGGQNQTKLLIEGLLEKGHKVFLASPADSALAHYFQNKIPVTSIGGSWSAAKSIRELCRAENIDVMDAQSSKAHHWALFSRWMGNPAKLVVHRRVDYAPSWLQAWKYRTRAVSTYVAISGAIAKILKQSGIASEKIRVVKSAASGLKPKFAHREEAKQAATAQFPQLDPRKKWIVSASALSAQKDIPMLLRAIRRLETKRDDLQVVIAGSGPEEKKIKALASDLRSVCFLGFVDEVQTLLEAAEVFAMSSQDEGLGTVILDAISCGTAVCATRVGGIPEIVEHGKTGLLCASGDDDHLSRNLMRMLDEPSFRSLTVQTAQQHIAQHFSLRSMIEGNIAVYREVLSGK